jgi:signal transduction histidine kinase
LDVFYPLIALCVGLAWLLVLALGYRRGSSKTWWPGISVLAIGMTVWNIGYVLQNAFPEPDVRYVTQLLIHAGILITSGGGIHFAVSLTRPTTGWRAGVACAGYLVSIAIFATARIPGLPTTVAYLHSHWNEVMFIHAVAVFTSLISLEIWELRHAEGDIERHRIKYVILATVIAVCGHMAEYSLDRGVPDWSLGNVTVLFCGAVIVYALTGDRLVSLSTMFRNARHAWAAVVLISIGYMAFLVLDDGAIRPWLVLVPVAVVFTMYVLFVSRDILFEMVERLLFTGRHRLHKELASFEIDLASISSSREMATRLLTMFTDRLNIQDALIIAAEEIEPLFVGQDDDETAAGKVRGEHVYALREARLLKIMELVKEPLRREDILRESWGDDFGIVFDKSAVEKAMNRMNCELLLPLMAGDRLLGALGLGEKASGDVYSDDDVRALRELASHVGLYLDNARIGYRAEQADKMNLLGAMADRIVDRLQTRVEVLRDTIEPLTPESAPGDETIMTLRREMAHVHDIINALRRFAQPSDVRKMRCDTNRVVRDVLAKNHWETWFEKVEIETEFEDDLPETFVDPAQMGRVVEAVLLNACESIKTRRGAVTISTYAYMSSTRPHVRIDIADTGSGIDLEDVSRIFEPMYTTKAGHTGVGLSIAYSLLKQNGCSISVSNASEDSGAVFTIRCPVWGRPVDTG